MMSSLCIELPGDFMSATNDHARTHDDALLPDTHHDEPVSRRGWGKSMLLRVLTT